MSAYLQGMGIGAGLIIAIGAQNAFVLSQGVRRQYQWMVATICSLIDVVLIFSGAAGIGAVVAANPNLGRMVAWGGALFLFYYGWRSLRSAMAGEALAANEGDGGGWRQVVGGTLAVSLLNPHLYLDTLVLLGSCSGRFGEGGRYLFALGACSASVVWFFTLSLGGVVLAPLFRSRGAWRVLDLLVCMTMWGIAMRLLPWA